MGLKSRLKSLLPCSPKPRLLPAAFVLVPLYIYPASGAWTRLYDSLSAHPTLDFTIIVNPDSGPGSAPYPEADYISGLAKLNSYPNTTLLGYVHVRSTGRALTDVQSDIATYAGWASYGAADIAVSGIFFDEAPNGYSGAAYDYMGQAAAYARSTLPAHSPSVMFNPGTVVDSRFFAIADNIVVFEDYAGNFDAADSLQAVPKAVRARSSVILHDFGGDETDLKSVVTSVKIAGIPGLFVSDAEYDSWGDDWEEFVGEMVS